MPDYQIAKDCAEKIRIDAGLSMQFSKSISCFRIGYGRNGMLVWDTPTVISPAVVVSASFGTLGKQNSSSCMFPRNTWDRFH